MGREKKGCFRRRPRRSSILSGLRADQNPVGMREKTPSCFCRLGRGLSAKSSLPLKARKNRSTISARKRQKREARSKTASGTRFTGKVFAVILRAPACLEIISKNTERRCDREPSFRPQNVTAFFGSGDERISVYSQFVQFVRGGNGAGTLLTPLPLAKKKRAI